MRKNVTPALERGLCVKVDGLLLEALNDLGQAPDLHKTERNPGRNPDWKADAFDNPGIGSARVSPSRKPAE